MRLYWKTESNKLTLLVEPAALVMTIYFRDHRWYLQCLNETADWSGNFDEATIKAKALEWFSGTVGRLATAITEIQGR